MKKKILLIAASIIVLVGISVLGVWILQKNNLIKDDFDNPPEKPVIYLYPTQVNDVSVKLNYNGELKVVYPAFEKYTQRWNVTAYPNGKLINREDGREYSYLFWEGNTNSIEYDLSTGFVVPGKDTVYFLQEKLHEIGLTAKEYNEFIVYWLPRMQNNKYNLIHFAGKEYTDNAKLDIYPNPDALLRVFMVFKPLNKKIEIKEQEFEPFIRKGFTVVEWGGAELK